MINPLKFINLLIKKNIDNFIGVPDSVLKNFLSIIPVKKNFVSNNEGSAIAHGIGYYLATKKIPLIYLQNSGLGNAINPLISIAHEKVYSVPLLLLIGWRGHPSIKDEPQHQAQGNVTLGFLKLLGIKYVIINNDKELKKAIKIINFSKKNKKPVAILIKNNSFEKKQLLKKNKKNKFEITRIKFLEILLKNIKKEDKLISTTGFTSRELFQLRKTKKMIKGKDFYMIGGMGHASNVGLGVSLYVKNNVIVLDGDGSMLMHLGGLANCGVKSKKNFKYLLLNNFSHESVGSQKTIVDQINLQMLSKSLGFTKYIELRKERDIIKKLNSFLQSDKKTFMNVKIKEGSIVDLTRPKNFKIIKEEFMKNEKN